MPLPLPFSILDALSSMLSRMATMFTKVSILPSNPSKFGLGTPVPPLVPEQVHVNGGVIHEPGGLCGKRASPLGPALPGDRLELLATRHLSKGSRRLLCETPNSRLS